MATADDCKDCISDPIQAFVMKANHRIEKIGGYDCYIATPPEEYAHEKVVLFLTDVFGLKLNNNLLLADDFALNGFKVVMPDIMRGEPVSDAELNSPTFKMDEWRAKHGEESWIPVVDGVVQALKASGVTRIGTTGYCFGAPPAFRLAFAHESHVTVLAHPSRLDVPGDLQKYKEVSKAPLLINSCETDRAFPKESQAVADEVLGNGQFTPGYVRTYWDGCTHGFAVRGDMSNPKVKAGKEGAFEASVKFYKKYL
ncbi:hypothetical protein EUX98_g1744 [Antrodiella citrinella]|uniref:Dienelactone hydrolase domain-containing protein n=1 Tax=Antrodiella citrinella TaxID=2447956 RepID=A0A4S4N0S1_9APHY|nr:hypothetical protein EUX98_g1744 [Antrodiella citrinella]